MKIYDNKGKTFDRYTIVTNGQVYGMSENPLSPLGFDQWLCTEAEAVALKDIEALEVSPRAYREHEKVF